MLLGWPTSAMLGVLIITWLSASDTEHILMKEAALESGYMILGKCFLANCLTGRRTVIHRIIFETQASVQYSGFRLSL